MNKEKSNNQSKSPKYSYTTISDYFLDEWSAVVGVGPTSLYLHLLKYCYKEKNLAWPTLKTLSKKMGVSERTIIRYRKTLVKYGFIQNIFKRNSTSRNNIYQMTLGQDISDLELLPAMVTNCPDSDNMSSSIVTKGQFDSDKLSSCKVTICHPNNNNLNNNNITTTKREKEAVVAVDFKKLKEEGEEKMQVIRGRLRDLDFEEEFMEQLLKDYPARKIEEKLDLLLERKNIQNPAGWLMAALKNDYRGEEEESRPVPHPHLNPPPSRGRKFIDYPPPQRERKIVDYPSLQREKKFKETLEVDSQLNTPEWTSREKALEAIKLIRDNLSLPVYPLSLREKGP